MWSVVSYFLVQVMVKVSKVVPRLGCLQPYARLELGLQQARTTPTLFAFAFFTVVSLALHDRVGGVRLGLRLECVAGCCSGIAPYWLVGYGHRVPCHAY